MLATSATASRTSASTTAYSAISIWEAIRQANSGEQDRVPVPVHAPAIPIRQITPSMGSAEPLSP
jgi:hypothetical protein